MLRWHVVHLEALSAKWWKSSKCCLHWVHVSHALQRRTFLFQGRLSGLETRWRFYRAADAAVEEPLFWLASESDVDLLFADALSHFADGLRFATDNACGDFQRDMQSARCTHIRIFCEVCMMSLLSAAATNTSGRCAH